MVKNKKTAGNSCSKHLRRKEKKKSFMKKQMSFSPLSLHLSHFNQLFQQH